MTTTPRRERWADSARGLAIVAVVLGHVFLQDDVGATWEMWGPAETAWLRLRDLLLPVRMPLFFLIAGYFAAHVITRPWRTVLRTRTFSLYYLYVVWVLVQTAYFAFVPHEGTAAATGIVELLGQLTYAPTNLWFLVALAVYFVVAKAGARFAPAVLLGAAVFSAAAFAGILPDAFERTPMPEYLVFFLVGAYAPGVLRSIRPRVPVVVAGLGLLSGGVVAMHATDDRMLWAALLLVSTVGGVTGIISLLKLLEARGRLPRATVWIGRRTLPIYVVQLPLSIGIDALIDLLPAPARQAFFGSPIVSSIYPIVVTALVIALALAIHRLARRVAPWLYLAPWLAGVAARPAPLPSGAWEPATRP
jgi:threonine dehydratase